MHRFTRGSRHYYIKTLGMLGMLVLVVVAVSTGLNMAHGANSGYKISKSSSSSSANWTMYQQDLAHDGYNAAETVINPNTVGSLHPYWIHHAGGTINTEPVMVNGLIYWGSWDGYEHATNPANPANDVWTANLGMMPYNSGCVPPEAGVGSTATINTISLGGQNTSVLFIGGGNGSFYALNALTGKTIWSTFLGSIAQGYFLWSSPVFYQGNIYMGVSSEGDCPLIRGYVVELNPLNGAQENIWYAVPQGCDGGGVWSTITVDQADGTLYFGTGTADPASCSTTEIYAEAMVELKASDLSFIGAWKIPASEQVLDGDIGSTMNLFTAKIGGTTHNLVGVPGKNGIYYAFDRDNVSAGPVWRSPQLATSGDTLASSAWDGKYLYVAAHSTTYNGMNCEDSMRALDPSSGNFVWTTCLGGGQANCAVIAVPGLVVVGIGYRLFALSTVTTATTTPGQVLFSYQEDQRGHDFYSVNILDGVLYAGNVDGNFYAFTPYNNAGISDDSNSSTANFDGGGFSYSAQALQTAGLVPGQTVTYNGVSFTWPNVSAGLPDNYQANGQTIAVTPVSGATTLAFLGSATGGPSTGTATITYTDGSTQTFSLGFSDWTLNANTASPSYGNSIVATMAYRNHAGAGPDAVNTYIFYASIALPSGKTLQSVTLPASVNTGQLHVFAISTGSGTPTPTPTPGSSYNNVGISDDSNSSPANFDGVGYSYSAQALKTAGLVPGQAVTYKGVSFTWPNVSAGLKDNYQANGQTIAVTPVSGATTLAFLGSATGGPSTGTATITYTDGSTQSFSLGFSDWTLNANTASPSYGNSIAATMAYRNHAGAGPDAVNTYIFYASIALQSGKTVQSVTLPASVSTGQLHVFAISTGSSTLTTPTPTPGSSYNNVGISDDSNSSTANFDGVGYSYSAQALKTAGLVPGQTVTYNGVSFTWPNVSAGLKDNYQANGQTIAVTLVSGATTLAFLGSATGGPSTGTATITYTDGTIQSFSLGFSDWTLNANTASPSYGNSIAATMSYRNHAGAGPDAVNTYIFYANIALQSGKTLQSVTLPASVSTGQLHVFAIGTK